MVDDETVTPRPADSPSTAIIPYPNLSLGTARTANVRELRRLLGRELEQATRAESGLAPRRAAMTLPSGGIVVFHPNEMPSLVELLQEHDVERRRPRRFDPRGPFRGDDRPRYCEPPLHVSLSLPGTCLRSTTGIRSRVSNRPPDR